MHLFAPVLYLFYLFVPFVCTFLHLFIENAWFEAVLGRVVHGAFGRGGSYAGQLSGNFRATVGQLLDNFLTTFGQLLDNFRSNFWTTFGQLLDNIRATFGQRLLPA